MIIISRMQGVLIAAQSILIAGVAFASQPADIGMSMPTDDAHAIDAIWGANALESAKWSVNASDHFNPTLASNNRAGMRTGDTEALGAAYCRRMLERCDNGDQTACDLFERYCGSN